MKVVINTCFGGFSISMRAAKFMAEQGSERAKKELESSKDDDNFYGYGIVEGMDGCYDRHDPLLVKAVETLGEVESGGDCAYLEVITIPDGLKYNISEYDGNESIQTYFEVLEGDLKKGLSEDQLMLAKGADSIIIIESDVTTEQEGLMEEHERQMNDDDDSRGFSNDDTPPRMYEDDESQAIYEAEKRMGA